MASTVKVLLHSAAIGAMLREDGVRADLRDRGERVLSQAQANAPVESGRYRDSLEVWDDTTDRAVVRVGSSLDYAPSVEAATGNLARALDAAG